MSEENTAEAVSLNDMFDADVEAPEVEAPEVAEVEQAEAPETAEQAEPVEQAPELIAPPEYFPKEFREHFDALQKLEGGKDYAQQWANQYTEHQKFINSKLDEVSKSKHDLDTYQQYQQALAPISHIWQSQGTHPAMGLARYANMEAMLQSDVGSVIKEILNTPQAIQQGFTLDKLVEEQPYIDPHIAEKMRTLEQQNQQFQQFIGQSQQGQAEQQNQAIQSEIQTFMNATEDGQPSHPYLDQVWQTMQPILNGMEQGRHTSPQAALKEAYDLAVSMNTDIQSQIQKEQEKAKAEQLHKEAQKASESDTRVRSKSKGKPDTNVTLNNMFDEAFD